MPRAKLKQRSDGRFRCWYKGKQFYGSTMREAYAKRDEYKRQIESGQNPERITVRVYADYWIPISTAHLAAQSRYKVKHLIDILCDEIGDVPLQSVRPGQIKEIFTKRFLGLSNDYISHAKVAYTELFDAAKADKYIQSNPCRERTAQPHKGTYGSHRPLTEEERHIVESCAKDHRVYPVAMVMLYAGLRPAEAQALHMDDVDFQHKQIHVHATYRMPNGTNQRVRTSDMKTKKSDRIVPLFSPLADILKDRSGLIISQEKGSFSRTAWSCAWKTYMKQLQKESGTEISFRPYDLRHTFCTVCRDNGIELHTCIAWMGHTDAKMIMTVYDSVTQKRIDSEIEKMENAIKNAQKKE